MTLLLFVLAAFVIVWPYLNTFVTVLAPGTTGVLPSFNIFDLTLGYVPQLSTWNFAEALNPIIGLVDAQAPDLVEFVPAAVFGLTTVIAGAIVFAARSWRLLWAPVLVVGITAAALGFGGADAAMVPALAGLGLVSLVFLFGGALNRIIDSARLERRIALLAEHLLADTPVQPTNSQTLSEQNVVDSTPLVAALAAKEVVESDEQDSQSHDMGTPVDTNDASETSTEVETAEPESEEAEKAESESVAEASSEDKPADETDEHTAEAETADDENSAASEAAESELDSETDKPMGDEIPAEVDAVDTLTTESADDGVEDTESSVETTESEPELLESATVSEDMSDPVIEDGNAETADSSNADTLEQPDDVVAVDAPGDNGSELSNNDDAVGPVAAEAPDAQNADPGPVDVVSSHDSAENERLKNDPRYAARAIILPPPPPMPAEDGQDVKQELADAAPELVAETEAALEEQKGEARETQTLKPDAPLPSNVVSIFGGRKPDDLEDA
jgi:hypothetical protein